VAKGLPDIVPRSKSEWTKLGNKVVGKIKDWTINKGRDVYGRPFKAYSKDYAERKSSGLIPRQSTAHAKGKPNFVLTNDTMGDLKVLDATRDSVTIGWASFGHIIEGQAKRGRVITADKRPVAKHIEKFIEDEYGRQIDRKLKKVSGTTIIKIGG